jgi:hypothetical protein
VVSWLRIGEREQKPDAMSIGIMEEALVRSRDRWRLAIELESIAQIAARSSTH